jgi:hypothetical protein
MIAQTAAVPVSSRAQNTARALYAVATLVTLWALGGGDMAAFWARSPLLAVAAIALGLGALAFEKRLGLLSRPSRQELMVGLGSGLALAAPTVVLIVAASRSVNMPEFLRSTVSDFHGPGLLGVLVCGLLWPLGCELISRGVLQPVWGIGNVAFLDALTVGFGTQRVIPFALTWGFGYFWGALARRAGCLAAMLTHLSWH